MMSVVIAACGIAARPVDDAEEPRRGRTAASPEDAVGPGLQRHVQGRADIGRLRHRLDDVVGELRRVRRGEPDPLEAVDVPHARSNAATRPRSRWVSGSANETP